MISPELLRRYPFFGFMDDTQLKAVAMIAEEVAYESGDVILNAQTPATKLYFLEEGSVSHYYVVGDGPAHRKLHIGNVNPGEIFGISALIEPYAYTATLRADQRCRVIKVEAAALRALCEVDTRLAYNLMQQTAKTVMQRLEDTRVQLAAAQS